VAARVRFTREAHVRFTTRRTSARASIARRCHGDVANQTVAERSVDHNMGFLRELP